ncbi:hypothetical protein BDR07DRAFT_1489182 [Suillus spraguei]|nr:hypothetical protein BDR07DRAFT_1489171 [Suillus spraguei]KAG2358669.1 hypothetical protein BDR07DRAFT_1489182 [Suillus spraguei]
MSERRFWEHNSHPGLVIISGVEYDVSRTSDGIIHCPAPTCSGAFKRRSTFKTHVEPHKDILLPALAPQSGSSELQVAVHPQVPDLPYSILANSANALPSVRTVSAVTLAEGRSQLPDNKAHTAQVISPDSNSHVILLPDEDYLLSTCLLDQFGLCMHTALKIFICMGCKKSLTAAMVPGHRKTHHRQFLNPKQLESLDEFVLKNKIYLRQEDVKIPTHQGPPVQLIAPPRKGMVCVESADCHYAASSIPTMINHGRVVHRVSKDVMTYEEAFIQQLFESVGRVYFVVIQPPPFEKAIDIRKVLANSFPPSVDIPAVPRAAVPDEERRSLIKVMAWDCFMQDVRCQKSQVKILEALKGQHRPEEFNGFFTTLDFLVKAYFHMAPELLEGNSQRFTICKLLLHGDDVKKDSDHWRPISKKNTSYSELILQFLRAIVRLYLTQDHPSKFSFGLHPNQIDALDAFVALFDQNDHGDDLNLGSDGDAMKRLHEFLWTLMDGASVHAEENWANVIQRFIWFKALRRDGNFYESTDFTPDLAKLKYFVNSTCLTHALWYQKDSDIPQIERIIKVHQEVLALGRATTFNMLFEYQQYASSLAWNQQREPKVFLDPDFQWITVGQETLYLSRFRQGIQTLLERVEEKYLLLTQGRIMLKGLPAHVADDMTNSIRGHSFANDKQFDSLRLELFSHLVEVHHLAMVDREGRLAWDVPAVKDILRRTGEVWKPLYHLLYITTQVSTRSVQFLQHQTTNAERHRNVFVQGQEVILLSGYSKTSQITDRDPCTPAFVHSKLGRWMVEFLAGGLRHAESLLAFVAYGEKVQHEYNSFLVMDNGHRINPDEWYAMFTQVNREHFQCAWGVRDFRQGAIAMAREFISPNHAFSLADDLLAESADHSTHIDHIHYGTVHGAVPELTNNVISKHRWLSEEWHTFCGLGPGDPQAPIRKRRSARASASSSNYPESSSVDVSAISEATSTAVRATLDTYLQENLVPLLRDAITQDILPSILHAVESPVPAPAMEPATGTGRRAPVQSEGDPDSNDAQHPIRFPTQPSSSSSRLNTRSAASLGQTTGMPTQSSSSSLRLASSSSSSLRLASSSLRLASSPSPAAPPINPVRRKRPPIQESSSQFNGRDGSIQPSKRIRLATSHLDATDLHVKKENHGKSLAAASSPHAEDLLLDDDEDSCSFRKEAFSSQPDDLITMDEDEDEEIEILADFSREEEDRWTQKVRAAFRQLFKDPTAKERSREQCKAIMSVMSTEKDTVITLKTGGGKSALWMTAPLIDPSQRCIVVCPFVVLLEEQVEKCLQFGLRAHNFTKDKNVPLDVQILFVQVESASSKAFQVFIASPQGSSFTKMFVDEHHDFLVCHPDRKEPWHRLAAQFSRWPKQINLLSATSPPSNTAAYLKAFSLELNEVLIYRTCTDRPEIGLHVLQILPNRFKASLQSLVRRLQSKMSGSDRMLVFFNSNKEADNFSATIQCAVFHSDLPTMGGNTKTHNLTRWDSGETKVMACTTAFAQGVDRSSVRFVVISEVEYGLMVVNQMSGRSGRDGREAHTFYLTQKTSLSSFESDQDYHCIKGLDDVLFNNECRRYTSIKCMDGRGFAYRCNDRPGVVKCDVCDPASKMQGIALRAIKDASLQPSSSAASATPKILVPSSSQPSQTTSSRPPSPRPSSFQPSSSRLSSSQGSFSGDCDAFFAKVPEVTSQMERALDAVEVAHTTRSLQCAVNLPNGVQPTYHSFSQPTASKAFNAPPAPSSLPAPAPSSSTRSARVTAGLHSRLDRTLLLDKYMRKLQNCCPVHFVIDFKVHAKGACSLEVNALDSMYYDFKRSFTFQRFTYCFKCALPQNYNHNKEEPSCHSQVRYQKGVPCPFAGFIFEAVYYTWKSGRADHLAGTLGRPTGWVSFEEFVSWVNEEEKDQGRYINLLELFIAFCKKLETSYPNFFQ